MNYYENIIIVDPTLGDEEVTEVSNKCKETIEKYGGTILKTDNWGRRKLAYELNKRSQGYYILYTFRAPSEAIAKMERFYRVYEPVFKFMFVRLEKKQLKALLDELKQPEEQSQETETQGA
ncbi:MAG: 30S ribosomal protein S6 [Nitrospirae bacterium]|nr:MAG: 30S ribosomal protein S6 [Nitrospirota bacterium]